MLKNRLTPWCPPNTGNVKLNTDGCWNDSTRKAGFGGIFRNEQGDWNLGYFGKMKASSSYTIILEKGMTGVQIESDSQIAVILFKDGANTNHPQSNIVNDGKYLLNRTGSTLIHTYRSANECADCLARIRAEQNEDLVVSNTPSLAIREFMTRDRLNIRQIID